MKRLLGNGFYLNVKFDQMTTNDNKNSTGDRLQIKKYHKIQDWELFDIKEGENLYSVSNKKNKKSSHSHVLSSLNGALRTGDEEKSLYDTCLFEGIAQTEHNAVKIPQVDQGLVSCVSGVITVMNDHAGIIFPGDLLYVTIPNTKKPHRGIHVDKMRFCLAPLTNKEIAQYYLQMWKDTDTTKETNIINSTESTVGQKTTAEIAMQEKFKKIANYSHIDRRQVAKAVSQARYGEKLDILLYPRLSD